MQAVVHGLLTNYELTGSGKLVVILHGWGDTSVGMQSLQMALGKQYQLLVPDLPGFGKTASPPHSWGLDDYATFISDLLHKLNLPQPYAIVGHSNGGAIAIRGLATGTVQADKLVLLASAGIRNGMTFKKASLQAVAKTGKVVTKLLPKNQQAKLRRKLYSKARSDYLVAEHLQETFKRIVQQDVQADAAKLTLPTLLIYGQQDTATPPEMGRTYNKLIQHSQLQIIEAGHFVHVDQLQQTTDLIREFL